MLNDMLSLKQHFLSSITHFNLKVNMDLCVENIF